MPQSGGRNKYSLFDFYLREPMGELIRDQIKALLDDTSYYKLVSETMEELIGKKVDELLDDAAVFPRFSKEGITLAFGLSPDCMAEQRSEGELVDLFVRKFDLETVLCNSSHGLFEWEKQQGLEALQRITAAFEAMPVLDWE